MNGLYFALRSGLEHQKLCFDPPQIKPNVMAYHSNEKT